MNSTPHEHWLNEMKKAALRLREFTDGNTQRNFQKPGDAVIRWALKLARITLEEISEGDFKNLQGELTCFSTFEMDEPYLRKGVISPGRLLGREEIARTQQWLRIMVEAIRSRNPMYFLAPQREWFAMYSAEDQRWRKNYIEDTVVGPGVTPLFHLLLERLDDLRECKLPDCGKFFLRERSNQLFCSKQHQDVDAKRRQLDIAPDRYGKRGRPPITEKPRARKPTKQAKKSPRRRRRTEP
jgi:hypothetical protein